MSRTTKKILENWAEPREGSTNSVSKKNSEREPIGAGRIGHVRGQNHMKPATPIGAKPERRLTDCRNFSFPLTGNVGPSQQTKCVMASE